MARLEGFEPLRRFILTNIHLDPGLLFRIPLL